MYEVPITGDFTSPGRSASARVQGGFNVSIFGTFVGKVQIERSFDAGANWRVVARDGQGTFAIYSRPVEIACDEPGNDVLYSLHCIEISSGTMSYSIRQ